MTYSTEIQAVDPVDGELKRWRGPNIEAISWSMAELYCQENGLGYCKVTGVLLYEQDTEGNVTYYERQEN